MLPCVRSVIDHRRRQNVVRTSVTHLAIPLCLLSPARVHADQPLYGGGKKREFRNWTNAQLKVGCNSFADISTGRDVD